MTTRALRIFSAGWFLLLLVFWVVSCAINPVTGQRELMLLSEAEEIELGRQTDGQVVREYGIYDDPGLTRYVNDFCQQLAKLSHRPSLPYQCKVVDSPVVNAFAVPGGYMYFTRGILAYMNNEAELIGVMGHELGHITARHSAQQYTRAQLAQVGLTLGSVFSESALLSNLAQAGVGMLFLKFSRDDERESDDLGVEYASKMGYDATQMANFFDTLNRMHTRSDRSGLPDWFSTHPNPVERNETVKRKAQEWQETLHLRNPKVNQSAYLRRVDGLVFGEDPRQGFVENNVFYHPVLQLEFPVPTGWKLQNTHTLVRMISPEKDALVLFILSSENSAEQAAPKFARKNQASVIESNRIKVNGLVAHRLISKLRSQEGILLIMSYFIEKDKRVYELHGISPASRFDRYNSTFQSTMEQFRQLTDRNKLKVKPARIRARPAPKAGTLRQVLRSLGTPEDTMEQQALLNGKRLDDHVPRNTLLKLVEK